MGLYLVKELPEEDQKWAFELMKTSVKELYVSAKIIQDNSICYKLCECISQPCSYIAGGWGWKDREKWEELTHETA